MDNKKIMKIVILVAITLIPIMYSFFFLSAFWDPYGNIEDLSVAIVNLDQGYSNENLGQKLVDTLQEKKAMNFEVISADKAQEALENQDYYALLTIPEDFTYTLNNAATSDREVAKIKFIPNQKSNYLASQIISKAVDMAQSELRGQVNEKIVDTLVDKMNEVPSKIQDISDGVEVASEGANKLSKGLLDLQTGTDTLEKNYSMFHEGINSVYEGSTSLNAGVSDLTKGINQVYIGSQTLAKGTEALPQMVSSVQTLAQGSDQFNQGVSKYVEGVNTVTTNMDGLLNLILASGNTPTAEQLQQIYGAAAAIKQSGAMDTITATGTQIKTSSQTINEGVQTLNANTSGLSKLQEGVKALESGLLKVKQGASSLEKGSATLTSGLNTLNSSSLQIQSGIKELNSGAKTALKGSNTLTEGMITFKTTVDTGIKDTEGELSSLDGLGAYAKAPVEFVEEDYAPVATYGIAFSPYFISLSLWVGALVLLITTYGDARKRFEILGEETKSKKWRIGGYAGLAAAQAVVLAFILKLAMGFTVTNTFLYYGTCILIAITFLSIIAFLIITFGDIGKFLAIILLILQLSACGGTLPLETTPKFIQAIHPFMPMTYSTNLLKESIIFRNDGFAMKNVSVLLGIIVVMAVCGALREYIKKKNHEVKNESIDIA